MIPAAENAEQLMTNLMRFVMSHGSDLPEHTREALVAASGHPSPVDRIVNSAEALFAAKAALGAEGREITAQLAQFAATNGWHGMAERGIAIAGAMNRIGGFKAPAGTSWPEAKDDPEPLARFLEEPAEPEVPAPAQAPE